MTSMEALPDTTAWKAQRAQGESLSTFLASLSTSGAMLLVGALGYILLKFKLTKH
jgi:hypothetical protein